MIKWLVCWSPVGRKMKNVKLCQLHALCLMWWYSITVAESRGTSLACYTAPGLIRLLYLWLSILSIGSQCKLDNNISSCWNWNDPCWLNKVAITTHVHKALENGAAGPMTLKWAKSQLSHRASSICKIVQPNLVMQLSKKLPSVPLPETVAHQNS